MFQGIRNRITKAISYVAAMFSQPAPTDVAVKKAGNSPVNGGSRKSVRIPDSNRAKRKAEGIPHGVPGAKLARKAAESRVGLR